MLGNCSFMGDSQIHDEAAVRSTIAAAKGNPNTYGTCSTEQNGGLPEFFEMRKDIEILKQSVSNIITRKRCIHLNV